MKTCSGCKQELDESNFFKRGDGHGFRSRCKACYREARKPYEALHQTRLLRKAAQRRCRRPLNTLLWYMRNRAKKAGIEFTIDESDLVLPDTCPILGLKIESQVGRGVAKASSPSVDRIDPRKGYVKGNVRVISKRANWFKSNFTPDDIERLYLYVNGRLP